MHQENNRYYELAEKWLKGTITEEEMKEFSDWYDTTNETIHIPQVFAGSEEELRDRILSRIKNRKNQKGRIVSLTKRPLLKLAVASAVIVISTVSLFYISGKHSATVQNNPVVAANNRDSIFPGGNKAVLILDDGSEVVLDGAAKGTIAQNKHSKVVKLGDGQLACSATNSASADVRYHTLSTPRGGQYNVTLVDGTTVWLNSSSSLRFPTSFREAERTVELSGEAYFEVTPNRDKPFKVKVNDVEVKVLGTHFNIMAYNDEKAIRTTLLEGSVAVSKFAETVLLSPGQQAQIGGNGFRIIKNADTDKTIAWKNGFFNFDGSDIETTMRQIARWYDVEVIHEGRITEHFHGTILRNASIEKVLNMLQFTGVVNFSIDGRKITVRN